MVSYMAVRAHDRAALAEGLLRKETPNLGRPAAEAGVCATTLKNHLQGALIAAPSVLPRKVK